MAQITLSDYVGFVFGEIVKARAIADAESRRIALLYSEDEVLKHFSVPRFKIPEMDISIPVLLSGAKYKTTLVFNAEQAKFMDFITARLNNAKQTILIVRAGIAKDFTKADSGILSPPILVVDKDPVFFAAAPKAAAARRTAAARRRTAATAVTASTIDGVINEFYQLLAENPDPSMPDNIVSVKWGQLFNMMITQNNLIADYTRLYPNGELFVQSSKDVLDFVKANTVVSKTAIENILINPETQTVKDGSNENSVFTLRARIVEDGVFIKELRDESGNVTERIVEFD
jgi:hypothetical protein